MESCFNELVRKLQIEKAGRLCTALRAGVHSYPINQYKTGRKNVWLFRANTRRFAVPKLRVLI
jgi:hypothetical protein